jgi:hypothetical protein
MTDRNPAPGDSAGANPLRRTPSMSSETFQKVSDDFGSNSRTVQKISLFFIFLLKISLGNETYQRLTDESSG